MTTWTEEVEAIAVTTTETETRSGVAPMTVWNSATGTITYGTYTAMTYGDKFVALCAGDNRTYFSTDGITWSTDGAAHLAANAWLSVAYDGTSRYVVVAVYASSNAYTAVSPATSTNWTALTLTSSPQLMSVAFGNGVWVITSNSSDQYYTSTDGMSWTLRNFASSGTRIVSFCNGVFVVAPYGGAGGYTSTNGVSWTSFTLPNTSNWWKTAYGNGVFVMSTYDGVRVATSTDGSSWTSHGFTSGGNYLGLSFGDGYFFITGTSRCAYSIDGTNWTYTTTHTGQGGVFGAHRFTVLSSSGFTYTLGSAPASNIIDLDYLETSFADDGDTFADPLVCEETAAAYEDAFSASDGLVIELLTAGEELSVAVGATVTDTTSADGLDADATISDDLATANEILTATVVSELEDASTTADDAATDDGMHLSDDLATADDLLTASVVSVFIAEELAVADDSATGYGDAFPEELGTADELLTAVPTCMLEDGATADELVYLSPNADLSVEDIASASEVLSFSADTYATETATADDAPVSDSDALIDEVVITDEVVEQQSIVEYSFALEDVATTDDALSTMTTANADLTETLGASDTALFNRPDLTAWVLNTESTAVNWYSNWGFTDMAVTASGKVFAVGPQGLAVIAGNTDDGDIIPASVVFDRTDFGGYNQTGTPTPNEQKKRVTGLYVGYRATTALTATLESWGPTYGAYTYTMKPRLSGHQHNDRIVPGKGLVSRYWRLSVANTAGGNFEVNSLSADIALSARRI